VPEIASWQDVVAKIVHVIPDMATPSQVQAGLRQILGDPSLEVHWWDWENERYVDVAGAPADLSEGPGRAVTMVAYESRRIGALVHDPALLDSPEFLGSFVPTMRIAMERDRLHRDLVTKLEQLHSSRQRIVTAADEERRRLERNLHDGAQQRLVAARLLLVALERRVGADPDLAPLARQAREELDGGLADLRELARGLHPPLLTEHGLEAAVRAGCERSSLDIDVQLDIGTGLPHAVEAAAYYVCSEAVTNAVKHASATRAWLSIEHANGWLTVAVRDDGIGGATLEAGEATGLVGLQDRVEALEGTFEVQSPPGGGTSVVAAFPLT
jgi:signal transduction histidine kinase